jgi:hypothetical protein
MQVNGPSSVETGEVLCLIGLIHKKRSEYEVARPYYRRALSIMKKCLGDRHPKIAHLMTQAADVERKVENWQESVKLYEGNVVLGWCVVCVCVAFID